MGFYQPIECKGSSVNKYRIILECINPKQHSCCQDVTSAVLVL